MRPVGLAWRSLTRQPARALLGIAGVAAVGALLFDMLMLSRGLVLSFEELLDEMGYDVRVTATAALPGMGPVIEEASTLAATVRGLEGVAAAVPVEFSQAVLRLGERSLSVFVVAGDADENAGWTPLRGDPLGDTGKGGPPPLLVSRFLADEEGVQVGDRLSLTPRGVAASILPAVEFQVTAVVEFLFDRPDATTVAVTRRDLFKLLGQPDRDTMDLLLVRSDPGRSPRSTVAAIRAAVPGVHVFTNEQLLRRFERNNFSYFRQIAFVLTSVTLFFSFLLVTTLLSVSVNQRFAEIAALRALGFARRRVVADLMWESALLVGAGTALSLPLGLLLARWLDRILKAMPGIPERIHFFVFQPSALGLHVALLAVAGLLAALYPVYLAARLPIAATLRRETIG